MIKPFLRACVTLAATAAFVAAPQAHAEQQYINVLTGGTSGVY